MDMRDEVACFVHADSDGDTILAEGVMKFCEDLGVEPADIVMVRGAVQCLHHSLCSLRQTHGLLDKDACGSMAVFSKKPPSERMPMPELQFAGYFTHL